MREGAEKGRGHAEHLVRVHIVHQGDYGSEMYQVAPCSVKTYVHWNAHSIRACYSSICV